MTNNLMQKTHASKRSAPRQRKGISDIDWLGAIPFIGLHLACLAVFAVGISPVAVLIGLISYAVRGFAVTGGYHRYFSHRTYRTGRVFQFIIGFVGTLAVQMGPLWWAAHHRNHHKYSDQKEDIHSPVIQSFWWSHIGWIMDGSSYRNVDSELIKDFVKFPELRWLDRWCVLPPVALALAMFGLGHYLQSAQPAWGTSGFQMLVWGFFISTVALHHATFGVNSIAHVFGKRRFDTPDQSRNNALLALVTFGEGWHNNHHRFPMSERQGIYWWEIDTAHAILTTLSWFGIVNSLRVTPKEVVLRALKTPFPQKEN